MAVSFFSTACLLSAIVVMWLNIFDVIGGWDGVYFPIFVALGVFGVVWQQAIERTK